VAKGPVNLFDAQLLRLLGTDGMAAIPMSHRDEIQGLLIIGLKEISHHSLVSQWTPLRLLANHAAISFYLERLKARQAEQIAAERLQAANRVAGKIAHEINNPLAILRNYLYILDKKNSKGEAISEELAIIDNELERICHITAHLKDLSKEQEDLHLEQMDLHQHLEEILDLFRASLPGDNQVTLTFIPWEKPLVIRADAQLLRQIMQNLLGNAMDAVAGQGRITVQTTTHLNAAVFSLHKSFFEAIKDSLAQMGLSIPIHILKADGGTMSLESSMSFPGQTVLSGPAASIMGAIPYAPKKQDAIVLDIGGTTTDIAFLVNKAPLLEPMGIQRGQYKSLIRSLQTDSKGIGGDSVVRVKDGELAIGPDRKGPAMAFGGPEPTPTDALVVLGLMPEGSKDNAFKGIHRIALELAISDTEAADKIFKKCCSIILKKTFEMIDKINSQPVYTVHEFLENYKISPRKIHLLGGPAPYFAKKIEELYHIKTIALPESSVANAIGAALARTTCEISMNADTEQGIVTAHEEDFAEPISKAYSEDDLIETAHALLKEKALNSGADPDNIDDVEVVEFQKFNIVRNFSPKGKIFRTKLQIKPGLIKGFESILPHP